MACKLTALSSWRRSSPCGACVQLWPAAACDWRRSEQGLAGARRRGLRAGRLLALLVRWRRGLHRLPHRPALRLRDAEPGQPAVVGRPQPALVDDQKPQASCSAARQLPALGPVDRPRELRLSRCAEMVRWGMGPVFGIAGWAGARLRAPTGSLRFAGPAAPAAARSSSLLYFGFMGRQFSLYLRYFLPLYPVLAVLAGFALVELVRGAASSAQRRRRPDCRAAPGYGAVAASCSRRSLLAALAYLQHLHAAGDARRGLALDVRQPAAPAASIAAEHWDDDAADAPAGRAATSSFDFVELPCTSSTRREKVEDADRRRWTASTTSC